MSPICPFEGSSDGSFRRMKAAAGGSGLAPHPTPSSAGHVPGETLAWSLHITDSLVASFSFHAYALALFKKSRFAHHLSYCRGACDWCSGDSGHRALALAQETELPLHSNRGQHLGTFGAAGERCSLRGARPKYTPLERIQRKIPGRRSGAGRRRLAASVPYCMPVRGIFDGSSM